MKEREYKLLEAIAQDETVTQAGLANGLGIAVGSVNWYIKRLIGRGYLKATRMDRTRLRYNLTAEGMAAFTRNATQYMKDSLKVYRELRHDAQAIVDQLQRKGVEQVYLEGDDEIMDILRLTCIEAGILPSAAAERWVVKRNGEGFELKEQQPEVDRSAA
ncbi:MAG: winged helix-turn-helix transcriptional regulator [Chloroflexi bacterium]|nr:winged helix-turn-helix transcriptional regulator [Chloroflexota bacterium]